MRVKQLIKVLLDYPMDAEVVINGVVNWKDLEEIDREREAVSLCNKCKFDYEDTALFTDENIVLLSATKKYKGVQE